MEEQNRSQEPPREDPSQKTKKKNRVIHLTPTSLVLATYLLLLLSKIIDITLLTRENEYYSTVLLQLMIFLLPAAIWCRFSGERYIRGLRLRLPKATTIPLMLSAAMVLISGSLLISFLFGGLGSLSGSFSLYDTFTSSRNGTVTNGIYLLLAYAVLPAICEEFVFRGILCFEYERGGVLRAIVLSSLFFSLLHFNLRNLPVYLFSGIVLALTLYATRSLFGAMLTHFLYNVFGLFGQPYMNTLYRITGSKALFLILVVLCFFGSAALFCGFASRLYRGYLYRAESAEYRKPRKGDEQDVLQSYLSVIKEPTTIACFAVYLLALVVALF